MQNDSDKKINSLGIDYLLLSIDYYRKYSIVNNK